MLPLVRSPRIAGRPASTRTDGLHDADIGADATYFSALTYQELFARMVPFGKDDSEYITYLRERYVERDEPSRLAGEVTVSIRK